MRYEGEHVLPESWWDGLPPLAKAVWKRAYRDQAAKDAPDPAAEAWDRFREEWAYDGQGWVMKVDLPGYRESDDGAARLWMGSEGGWVMSSYPPGSLELPGNHHVPQSEVETLPEAAREVYETSYKRLTKSSAGHAHAVASNVLRAEFKKTEDGWTEKGPHEKPNPAARTRERLEAHRPFFDEWNEIEAAEPPEMIAETEYPNLPDTLKTLYRKAYRCALRNGSRWPVRDAWSHIRSNYAKSDGAWAKRTPEFPGSFTSKVERLCGPSLEDDVSEKG